ncbi:hypothetical protein [Tropicimonas sp. S265A]|uniref:hypothetical protein n=1 Tax=Tropicimonas sp. S265A TaxID=3415134 RepID=UPI003C7A862E
MKRALTLCAALALATPVAADVRASYVLDGRTLFSMLIPDFWTLKTGGERLITPPDEDIARPAPQIMSAHPTVEPDVWIGAFSPRGIRTVAEGRAYLAEIGQFLTTTPEITSTGPGRIGGMAAHLIKGTGRRDGRDIAFTIAVLDLPGQNVGIVAGIAEQGADPALVAQLNETFASVRAAR